MARTPDTRHGTLKEMAEDASGFGMAELRLTRDLILRPRRAMDAYDEHGATAGGLYPRPLRYYLGLNGALLLMNAVAGGVERTMAGMQPQMLTELAERAGKSRDEFIADFDQWFGILSVPVYTLVMALPIFFLIAKWSPLKWRADLCQTFTFLNAWTLYQVPLMVLVLISPSSLGLVGVLSMLGLVVVLYARVGRGRWWRTPTGAVLKGALLVVVTVAAMVPASFLAYVLSSWAAIHAP